jgi:hypothetical protein
LTRAFFRPPAAILEPSAQRTISAYHLGRRVFGHAGLARATSPGGRGL